MKLQKDLREFIELLNSEGVDYVVVGAYSLAYHGLPRYTGDIDFFIRPSPANAARLEAVVRAFGFEQTGLCASDFLEANQVIQLGRAPNRIDLLTGIDGVDFEEAWNAREPATLDGLPVFMMSKDLLIRNKLAVARPQDLADAKRLQEMD